MLSICATASVVHGEPAIEPPAASHQESQAIPVDLSPRPLGTSRTSPVTSKGAAASASAWDFLNPVTRTAASLAVVLVLIGGLAMLVRRLSKPGSPFAAAIGSNRSPAGIIEVLGRYPLSRGHALVLLKIERRVLLVSHPVPRLRSPAGQVSVLAQFDDPEDVASILLKAQDAEGASTAEKFRELLSKFDTQHDDGVQEVQPLATHRRATNSAEGDRVELWEEHPDALRLADVEDRLPRAVSSRSSGGRR